MPALNQSKSLYAQIQNGDLKVSRFTSSPELRFWDSLTKEGPNHPTLGKCWNWLLSKSHNGYGQFTVKYKQIRAHRFAYNLLIGPFPQGMDVLHKCDNPACVNPKHLFLGNAAINQKDKVNKQRQACGEENAISVLTEFEVLEIRRRYRLKSKFNRYSRKNSQGTLAREFGVTQANISEIVRRKTWKHVP